MKLPSPCRILTACVILLPVLSLFADNIPGGHSVHGEVFNEGPRQAAVLLEPEDVGRVEFVVTTVSEKAQKFFNQGVAQLHGFWFYEAERSFRQALLHDPACGMAYWGLALANRNNPKRARGFLEKAEPYRAGLTAKEVRWIETYRPFFEKDGEPGQEVRRKVAEALESMAFDFPEDMEIKVWVVLQHWENESHGVAIGSREGLDSILREVLMRQQWHPGAHHLRIHLWNQHDDRRALKSAAVCGQTGVGVAHLWHMPGHTFSALKRYADAAWQQEAAARTDHAWMIANRLMPDEIHNYAHNNDWLVENLAYVGRISDAVKLAMNMVELPQLAPKTEVIGNSHYGEERSSFSFGSRRLAQTLAEFEMWERLIELESTPYLAGLQDVRGEAVRLNALVRGYSALKRLPEAQVRLDALELLLPKVRQERFEAADRAEQEARKASKSASEVAHVVQDALQKKQERVNSVDSLVAQARMAVALANGEKDEAAVQLVAAKELSLVDKSRAQYAVDEKKEALATAREAVEKEGTQVLRVANLVELLWLEGEREEAVVVFEKLRLLGAGADINLPILERLKPVAGYAKVSGDWRVSGEGKKDIGTRPPLSSLGPFRWESPKAQAWALPSDSGKFVRSEELKGKTVLLMFYLGSGCIHCIEQLNQFAPFTEAYEKAGITLLAVSADSQAELHKTMEKAKSGGGFPFSIVADPTLGTFKAYRAYDDFEHQALHGLFLIDSEGRIRWQNISFQPFTQPEWLLKESQRLLGLKG